MRCKFVHKTEKHARISLNDHGNKTQSHQVDSGIEKLWKILARVHGNNGSAVRNEPYINAPFIIFIRWTSPNRTCAYILCWNLSFTRRHSFVFHCELLDTHGRWICCLIRRLNWLFCAQSAMDFVRFLFGWCPYNPSAASRPNALDSWAVFRFCLWIQLDRVQTKLYLIIAEYRFAFSWQFGSEIWKPNEQRIGGISCSAHGHLGAGQMAILLWPKLAHCPTWHNIFASAPWDWHSCVFIRILLYRHYGNCELMQTAARLSLPGVSAFHYHRNAKVLRNRKWHKKSIGIKLIGISLRV